MKVVERDLLNCVKAGVLSPQAAMGLLAAALWLEGDWAAYLEDRNSTVSESFKKRFGTFCYDILRQGMDEV